MVSPEANGTAEKHNISKGVFGLRS
jgi:hypothetical protein